AIKTRTDRAASSGGRLEGEEEQTLVQRTTKNAGTKGTSKTEVELKAEIDRLRFELDSALLVIKKMKEALGQAPERRDEGPSYRGRPLRFWMSQAKDADPKFRAEAVEALGVFAEENKELIPLLAAALKDRNAQVERKASSALGRLGANAVPALR